MGTRRWSESGGALREIARAAVIGVGLLLGGALTACDLLFGPGQTYRGHYAFGFEENDFYRCGTGFAQRWWVTGDLQEVNAFIASHPASTRVFVHWRGEVGAAGTQGLEREIRVTDILEVRESRTTDCS